MWSTEVVFSPSSSTLISDATRFRHFTNAHSTYYIRYNDSAYLGNTVYVTAYYTPISTKLTLAQDFVITDFKKFYSNLGFIGSFGGTGMYGWAVSTNHPTSNQFYIFKLPEIKRLTRIETILASNQSIGFQVKAFAIGDKSEVASDGPTISCILEFYARGNGAFMPYYYAPLAIDPVTYHQEIADDVTIIDDYVIYATRDTRDAHSMVNLRISDTNQVLQNTSIDSQWRFAVPNYHKVVSELRLHPLNDGNGEFILAYVVQDTQTVKYYLCTHKIKLSDLFAGYNTVVYSLIPIDEECTNLVDVIYEPDVYTLVFLLNGSGESRLCHVEPYSTGYPATILDYPDGELTSIDTIGSYPSANLDMYVAAGGDRFFSQDISSGIAIDRTCLTLKKREIKQLDPLVVKKSYDPISRFSDDNEIHQINNTAITFYGDKTCDETDPNEKYQLDNQ